MPEVTFQISMSLDGYVAGSNADLENPLGVGGEQLHEWIFGLRSWREPHGLEGGVDNEDSRLVAELIEAQGAVIMGRRMFSNGSGPWEDDPNAGGWWGETPPFHVPVFVLTHHAREPLELSDTTFHFVTDGPEAALERAREAAGERDVSIAGGAEIAREFLRLGFVDRMHIHVTPILLGGGVALFEGLGPEDLALDQIDVRGAEAVTHITYRPRSDA